MKLLQFYKFKDCTDCR